MDAPVLRALKATSAQGEDNETLPDGTLQNPNPPKRRKRKPTVGATPDQTIEATPAVFASLFRPARPAPDGVLFRSAQQRKKKKPRQSMPLDEQEESVGYPSGP